MKIIERIHNVETGETSDIERDMTADELAQYNAALERNAKELAEKEVAEAKREIAIAKLAALGLQEDDLKALGL